MLTIFIFPRAYIYTYFQPEQCHPHLSLFSSCPESSTPAIQAYWGYYKIPERIALCAQVIQFALALFLKNFNCFSIATYSFTTYKGKQTNDWKKERKRVGGGGGGKKKNRAPTSLNGLQLLKPTLAFQSDD